MVYINLPSVQKLSALPPKLGMNNGGNVLTFQSTTTNQSLKGVPGLPIHLIGPKDHTTYTCNSVSGKCESEKGNVADGAALVLAKDRVCKAEVSCTNDKCTCDWKQ